MVIDKYFVLAVLVFAGCVAPPASVSVSKALETVQCPSGDYRGQSVKSGEEEALAVARTLISEQIQSSIKSSQMFTERQIGNELSSEFVAKAVTETALDNAHDMRVMHVERNRTGEVGVVLCMSRADAAKGFIERQRHVASSLEFAANAILETKHPKLKSEAWQRAKPLWNEFMRLQVMIEGLDKAAAVFEPVKAMYAKAKEDYLGYCQTAKLYWNPEHDDFYSEKAFAKLSKSSKLEKASCKGNGVSLVYRNSGHRCEQAGIFKCYHKPSLLVASCYGEEYGILESPNVEVFQKREDVALEKLREKLEYESFWSDWEKEIKQWSPQCE
ncbi:MAG: hypothetical protein FWC15_01485 [Fibromonadales bacterium]|nr:hypothetical protein [Fibromonadales bacterium]